MRRCDSWSVAEVLDFEAFVAADEQAADRAALADRDARWWREKIAPGLSPQQSGERRIIFRRWLEARRAAEGGMTLGKGWRLGWSWLRKMVVVGGLLLGALACLALLTYQGAEPLNAPHFLAATVLLPWLPLLAGLLLVAFRAADDPPLLRHLLLSLARRSAGWFHGASGEQHDRWRARLAAAEQRVERHGPLLLRQAVSASQQFALMFHVGALLALLAGGYARDLRFGWESTLLRPQQWETIVQITASPWAWAAPEARPSTEQIAASQYVRGQQARDIPPAAAQTWLRFLQWSLVVWGIAPRALLFSLALLALRRSLDRLEFDHREARALQRRLTDAAFATAAPDPLESPGGPAPAVAAAPSRAVLPCWLLRAEESPLSVAALSEWAARKLRWQVVRSEAVQPDFPSGNGPVLTALAAARAGFSGVLVALPEELPPIAAAAEFLRRVSAAAGAERELTVLLTGAGAGETCAPPLEARVLHWRDLFAREKLNVLVETWTPA